MTKHIIASALFPALAACASMPETGPIAQPVPPAGVCHADRIQDHLGHTASAQSGAKLLELSGARTLRWGPPGAVWTMDYRDDRLNVRYDGEMKIVEISCV